MLSTTTLREGMEDVIKITESRGAGCSCYAPTQWCAGVWGRPVSICSAGLSGLCQAFEPVHPIRSTKNKTRKDLHKQPEKMNLCILLSGRPHGCCGSLSQHMSSVGLAGHDIHEQRGVSLPEYIGQFCVYRPYFLDGSDRNAARLHSTVIMKGLAPEWTGCHWPHSPHET